MAATSPATRTGWRIVGEEVIVCNCAWGCPCQFNALPTHGRCEGMGTWEIQQGYFGETRLDGTRFAVIYRWPGAVHEGNGTRRLIIDERATPEQRDALLAMESGTQGHPFFEIFVATAPNALEPVVAPIELERDREGRRARVRIPGITETRVEPISNPVSGEEHRARIDLPNGFEYKLAEVANTASWKVTAGEPLVWDHENTHGHLAKFDWSSDGATR